MANTISITQGEDYTLNLNFVDGADDPYDLTGCSIQFYLRRHVNSTTPVIAKAAEIDDAALGLASLELSGSDTDIDIRCWFCQVVLVDADGNDHPSIATPFLVTNLSTTSGEIDINVNLGTMSGSSSLKRRWTDSQGNKWDETINTDGALETTPVVTTEYLGMTLALQGS